MFWVVDNFLMHKAKKSQKENESGKVQFRKMDYKDTEEVEVLLSSENTDSDKLVHRDVNAV